MENLLLEMFNIFLFSFYFFLFYFFSGFILNYLLMFEFMNLFIMFSFVLVMSLWGYGYLLFMFIIMLCDSILGLILLSTNFRKQAHILVDFKMSLC